MDDAISSQRNEKKDRNKIEDFDPAESLEALKDAFGANLDRIQVIKGWLDASGETHERIYDVSVSDGRKISRWLVLVRCASVSRSPRRRWQIG